MLVTCMILKLLTLKIWIVGLKILLCMCFIMHQGPVQMGYYKIGNGIGLPKRALS